MIEIIIIIILIIIIINMVFAVMMIIMITYAEDREGRSKSNDEPPSGENKVEHQYEAPPDHHHLGWCEVDLNRRDIGQNNVITVWCWKKN